MFRFKKIPKGDLARAYKMQKDYTGYKGSFAEFREKYRKCPDLFAGCYIKQNLIGICHGFKRGNLIILWAIAVYKKYAGKGIGSRLLKFFVKQVKKIGEKTLKRKLRQNKFSLSVHSSKVLKKPMRKVGTMNISVASAEGYVEKFYLKNGFKPKLFLVRINRSKLPKNYRKKPYEITMERGNHYKKILYIKNEKYSPKLREKVKKAFNAYEVDFIFEKEV